MLKVHAKCIENLNLDIFVEELFIMFQTWLQKTHKKIHLNIRD
jgi:hypothetical protein